MNERIQELAEQAGLKYHNWITNESNIDDGDFKYPRLEDLEKFAELIIRESIEVVKDSQGYNQYFPHVAENIKQHFGVE